MAEHLEEANSHYSRTIGIYKGNIIQLEGIVYDPKATGISRNNLNKYMSYEEARSLMLVEYRLHGKVQPQRILLSDIVFPFPESKLINSIENKRAKAVFINRYSYRQWRRGLRMGMLQKVYPNLWLIKQLGLTTSTGKNLTWKELEEFFNPTYYNCVDVQEHAIQNPGTYAISPEFWVGVGRSGLVFGYHQYTVGKIIDGEYELHADAQDLFELLNETVGGGRASIRGHRVSQGINPL